MAAEAVHLEHIADDGESAATLLIVFAAVLVFASLLTGVLMVLDFSAASLLGG